MLALLLLAACQPGSSGPLEPIIGAGVEEGPEADSALVRDGAVSATIEARWGTHGSQSAVITYANDRPTPVAIALPRLLMRHRLGDAPLWTAVDLTGVDLADKRTDNDDATVLYDLDKTPATTRLTLRPGERRRLDVSFPTFPSTDEEQIEEGDRVVITVPLADRDAAIAFVAD